MSTDGRERRLAGSFNRAPFSILIVDQDTESAARLARELKQRYAVAVVGSMQAALATLKAQPIDLLVTEIELLDGDGIQLIATLHASPATRHLLLMVVSGRRSVHDKVAAFQAGADDYLVKPVDPQLFEIRVRLLSRFRQILSR
jgi:DNA-binding response OmpR family regulator